MTDHYVLIAETGFIGLKGEPMGPEPVPSEAQPTPPTPEEQP